MRARPACCHRAPLPRLLWGLLLLTVAAALGGCRGKGASEARPREPAARAPAPPGRVLYDFLASRPLALVYEDEALVIEPSAPDIYKFIDGGWKASLIPGERDLQGRTVALADGLGAVVRFPAGGLALPAGAPAELSLWMHPAADVQRQAVTILLNERVLANLDLSPEHRRYHVPIGAGRLSPGENMLRLHFRSGGTVCTHRSAAAIERLTIGPATQALSAVAAPAPGPAEALVRAGTVRSVSIGGESRPALLARVATRWSYYLVPPRDVSGVRLRVSLGQAADVRPVEFAVRAVRDGEPEQVLLKGLGVPGRWRDAEVDVTALLLGADRSARRLGGAALRIDLSTTGPAAIAGAKLVLTEEAPGGADLAAPARAEHLLVFAVDALRADRLRGKDTPQAALRQLQLEGVRLLATSQGNYGLPAHASILTGTYPAVHRLTRDAAVLDEQRPVLQEALRRAGFVTGLFSGSGYVSDRWGLSRGFDAYRNLVREGRPASSAEVWKLARPWLEEQVRGGRRVFLYLATADPHAPYNPAPGLLPAAAQRGYTGPIRPALTAEQLVQVKRGKLHLSQADRAYLEALYDAEVSQTDATLKDVLAELQRLGVLEKTAVVLLGSHGEEFFDHGSVGHGHSLYDELVSVPLLLRFPARLGRGEAPALSAELLDLAPTLLHLASAAVPESMQGESLLPLLPAAGQRERPQMPRAALSQHGDQLRSLSIGRYKLITSSGDRLLLFDRARDPGEQHDLSAEQPIALRALRNALSLLTAVERRWNKARFATPADLRPGFGEDIGL